ncbi:MAG: hypothetical protein ACPGLR_03740, partial [Flavobacteriaceae bacterium]
RHWRDPKRHQNRPQSPEKARQTASPEAKETGNGNPKTRKQHGGNEGFSIGKGSRAKIAAREKGTGSWTVLLDALGPRHLNR